MFRSIAAVVTIVSLLSTTVAWGASAEERAQATADTRQGLLKVVVSYFGPIVGMAKEQIPYDAALVKTNAAKIAKDPTLKNLSLMSFLPRLKREHHKTENYNSENFKSNNY